jgi:hypothetical protein
MYGHPSPATLHSFPSCHPLARVTAVGVSLSQLQFVVGKPRESHPAPVKGGTFGEYIFFCSYPSTSLDRTLASLGLDFLIYELGIMPNFLQSYGDGAV